MRRRWVAATIIGVLILAASASANYAPPEAGSSPPAMLLVVLSDYTVDLLFIMVGLTLARRIGGVPIPIIMMTVVGVMIGGLAADAVGSDLVNRLLGIQTAVPGGQAMVGETVSGLSPIGIAIMRAVGAMPFIFAFNYFLSRLAFETTRRESAIVGLVMSVCTLPILYHISDALSGSTLGHGLPIVYVGHLPFERALVGLWILAVSGAADAVFLCLLVQIGIWRRLLASAVACICIAVPAAPAIRGLSHLAVSQRQIDVCASKLRLANMAISEYVRDHSGYPPTLQALVPKYLSDASLLHCPADPRPGPLSYTYHPLARYEDTILWVWCPGRHRQGQLCWERQYKLRSALGAYRRAKGNFPDSLHDLVPGFADEFMLQCPIATGRVSYSYEKLPPDAGSEHVSRWIVRCEHHGTKDKWLHVYRGIPSPTREITDR